MTGLSANMDFVATAEEVTQHLLAVLEAAKFKVKSLEGNTITAQTGFSLTSLGSQLTATLEQTDPSTVRVTFDIKPRQKTVMTDWGRSKRELKRILRLLEARLASQSSESDKQCAQCSAPVQDADIFCTNCGTKIR